MSLSANVLDEIAATIMVCGALVDPALLKIYERDLSAYPEPVLLAALARCRRELVRRPDNLLAAIIERIEETKTNGWPTPNEAWAAVGTLDEQRTIVCVEQAFEALANVVDKLAEDEVAARMSFLDSYKRKVAAAKAAGWPPRWTAQLGLDVGGRAVALRAAVEQGRIPEANARHLLGGPVPGLALPASPRRPQLQLAGKQTPEERARAEKAQAAAEILHREGVLAAITALADPASAEQWRQERAAQWAANRIIPLASLGDEAVSYVSPNRKEVAAMRARR